PSFESYYNAKMGKYGIVELFTRYANLQLPKIEVVDMHDLRRRKIIKGYFSPLLLEEIESALDKGEQVILFQNRRGFSQMMECRECRKVLQCKNCDVSLVYHKELNRLVCHYCGESYPIPTECPHCSSKMFLPIGLGTEQIEETIQHLYPSARVSRMDLDTTRSRKSYTQIIQDFANGKTDILIGTQMVAKGLDFEKVSLVGILNADTLLNFPDFRAQEHAFQMIQQVAGRAGRKGKQGKVLIQTYSPEHLVIQESIKGDFSSFYTLQMEERKEFHYPPYYRLIYIYMKHKNEDILDKFSHIMEEMLHRCFSDENILGPDKPVIERVQTLFIRKIILKIRSNLSLSKAKASLQEIYQEILSNPEYKSIFLYYDVDPM
ncbi:MAG TPA: primosomal protein N', partial [Porphyromonadaceae bacterium]|nr:primosomal protein N' [Porphyromonadaceae bacterium]